MSLELEMESPNHYGSIGANRLVCLKYGNSLSTFD